MPQQYLTNGSSHMRAYATAHTTMTAVAAQKYKTAGVATADAVGCVADGAAAQRVRKETADTDTPATACPVNTPCGGMELQSASWARCFDT